MSRGFPVLERQPLALPMFDDRSSTLWDALCDLAVLRPGEWTLIGAQMVLLHGLEHDQAPPRASQDLDVLVDARVSTGAVRQLVAELEGLGFGLHGAAPGGIAHRYLRDGVSVDVLAPEGLGRQTDLTTTPPGRTLQVPGGTQALQRTELIPISHRNREVLVPRPNLVGAIVAKACAVEVDDLPDNQRLDLAFLLGLIDEPMELADELDRKDRRRLRRREELLDAEHRAWRASGAGERGHAALALLIG